MSAREKDMEETIKNIKEGIVNNAECYNELKEKLEKKSVALKKYIIEQDLKTHKLLRKQIKDKAERIENLEAYNDHTFDAKLKENADIIQENKKELESLGKSVANEVWRNKTTPKDIADFVEIIETHWKKLDKEILELKERLASEELFTSRKLDKEGTVTKQIAELKESVNIVADNSGNFEDMLLTKINNQEEISRELMDIFKRVCHNLKKGVCISEDWDEMWDGFKLQISKLEEKLGADSICKCGKTYREHFIDNSYKDCKYLNGGETEDSARHIRPYSNLNEVKPAGNQSENYSKPQGGDSELDICLECGCTNGEHIFCSKGGDKSDVKFVLGKDDPSDLDSKPPNCDDCKKHVRICYHYDCRNYNEFEPKEKPSKGKWKAVKMFRLSEEFKNLIKLIDFRKEKPPKCVCMSEVWQECPIHPNQPKEKSECCECGRDLSILMEASGVGEGYCPTCHGIIKEKSPESNIGSTRQTDYIKWIYMESHFNCLENFRIVLKDDILVKKAELEFIFSKDPEFMNMEELKRRRRIKEKWEKIWKALIIKDCKDCKYNMHFLQLHEKCYDCDNLNLKTKGKNNWKLKEPTPSKKKIQKNIKDFGLDEPIEIVSPEFPVPKEKSPKPKLSELEETQVRLINTYEEIEACDKLIRKNLGLSELTEDGFYKVKFPKPKCIPKDIDDYFREIPNDLPRIKYDRIIKIINKKSIADQSLQWKTDFEEIIQELEGVKIPYNIIVKIDLFRKKYGLK